MSEIIDFSKHAGIRSLMRRLAFMTFGVAAFVNPMRPLAIAHILFGLVVGLFFGWICKLFLVGMLGLFNPTLRKEQGKVKIRHAVEHGMLYMIPFAILAALSAFYLKWTITTGFFSTALMTAGGIAAFEIGRLRGKQAIKNTLLTSGLSFLFSTSWLLLVGILANVPAMLDGLMTFVQSLAGTLMN